MKTQKKLYQLAMVLVTMVFLMLGFSVSAYADETRNSSEVEDPGEEVMVQFSGDAYSEENDLPKTPPVIVDDQEKSESSVQVNAIEWDPKERTGNSDLDDSTYKETVDVEGNNEITSDEGTLNEDRASDSIGGVSRVTNSSIDESVVEKSDTVNNSITELDGDEAACITNGIPENSNEKTDEDSSEREGKDDADINGGNVTGNSAGDNSAKSVEAISEDASEDSSTKITQENPENTSGMLSVKSNTVTLAAPTRAPFGAEDNNSRTVTVTKRWEDSGHENQRPATVTFDIYCDGRVIRTITLSGADVNPENDSEWIVSLELPDTDDEGNKLEYSLLERTTEESPYLVTYNSENGLIETVEKYDFAFVMSEDSVLGHLNDNGEMEYSTAHNPFRIYRYSEQDGWSAYYEEGVSYSRDGVVDGNLGGKILHFSDSNFISLSSSVPRFFGSESRLGLSDAKNYIELTGQMTPAGENFSDGDVYYWSYKPSLGSSYTYYFLYYGSSCYGGKIDVSEVLFPTWSSVVTNIWNLQDVPYKKVWEDAGHEEQRPETITLNLYSDHSRDEAVATVTMPVDKNISTMTGVFKDLPIYDKNQQEIRYYIQEQYISEYYKPVYDVMDGVAYGNYYNGLAVTFGETSDKAIMLSDLGPFFSLNHLSTTFDGGPSSQRSYISNRTIVFPTYSNKAGFAIINYMSDFLKWEILDVAPVHIAPEAFEVAKGSSYAHQAGTGYWNENYYDVFYGTFDDFLSVTSADITKASNKTFTYQYTWQGMKDPFDGALMVTNKLNMRGVEVTKRWNDEGHEDERPDSVEIEFYRADDPDTVQGTLKLTAEDAKEGKSNEWTNSLFLLDEDKDGNTIVYTIKEKAVEGYLTGYDTPDSAVDIQLSEDTYFYYNNMYINGALKIYRFDEETRTWYYYWEKETDAYGNSNANEYNSITGNLSNQIFHLNDESFYRSSRTPEILETRLAWSDEKNYIELVGDEFADVDYVDLYDYYVWKYVPTIGSRYTYYMIYMGDSWKGGAFHTDKVSFPEYRSVVINTWNKQDVECEKEWDDAGYEQYRPETITLDLYSDHSPDKVLDSITLTVTDATTLKGVFKDLPIYDESQKKIQYYIQERDVPEYYRAVYDVIGGVGYGKEYNALVVTFGETGKEAYLLSDGLAYISLYNTNGVTYRDNPISYRTIVFPMFTTDNPSFTILNWTESFDKWEITDIRPGFAAQSVYYNLSAWSSRNTVVSYTNPEYYDVFYATYDDFLNVTSDDITKNSDKHFAYQYSWQGLLHPFANGLKVRNVINATDLPVLKEWNEGEYADFRPDKVIFELYNRLDKENPVKTVELTRENLSDANENLWKGLFSQVPLYNEDGTPAEYYIVEKVPDGYTTESYANDKTRDKIGAMKVTFGEEIQVYGPGYLYYYDEEGNPFCAYLDSRLAGKSIIVPADDFYIAYVSSATYTSYNRDYPDYTLKGWFNITDISSTTEEASEFRAYSKSSFSSTLKNYFGSTEIREMYGASSWKPDDYLRYGDVVHLHFTAGEQSENFAGANYVKNTLVETPFEAIVVKLDGEQNMLAGAGMRITGRWSRGTEDITPKEWISSALEGKSWLLLPGTYVLEEVNVPEGYLSAEPITFTIAEDGSITVKGETVSKLLMIDEKKPEEEQTEEPEKPTPEKPDESTPTKPNEPVPEKPEQVTPETPEQPTSETSEQPKIPVQNLYIPTQIGVATGDTSHVWGWLMLLLATSIATLMLARKKLYVDRMR